MIYDNRSKNPVLLPKKLPALPNLKQKSLPKNDSPILANEQCRIFQDLF